MEPHNLLRQNFYPGDVGGFKSQVLADRLAKAYNRPVGYSVYPFKEYDERPNGPVYPGLIEYGESLIIGCADNAAARRAMAECLPGTPPAGSSTRATTPTGARCSSGTSRAAWTGRSPPSRARPATWPRRPRSSAPTC